jgi:hypothetical protein
MPSLAFGCSLLILGVVFQTQTARAYRPFDGTDGDVAELGEFELEIGPLQFQREGDQTSWMTPTVLNLGVMPRVEFVADFVPIYASEGRPYELTDTDIFAKFLVRKGVLQEESGPSIAIETGPLLPEIHGEDGYGASLDLIISERYGWLTLHLNDEAELSRGDLLFGWATNLIGEVDLGSRLRPVVELGWETEVSSKTNTFSALAGAIWNVSEGFDVDAAGRVARVDGTSAFEARIGLTWAVYAWEPAQPEPATGDDRRAAR